MDDAQKLTKLILEAKEGDDEKRKSALADFYTKLYSNLYDKASTYTNLVLSVGYAGFFATWGFCKEYLSKEEMFWSALLMSISLFIFVGFEVFKMIYTARQLYIANPLIQELSGSPVEKQTEIISKYSKMEQKLNLFFVSIWPFVLAFTIVSAVTAVVFLLNGFGRVLVTIYFSAKA